MKNYYINRNTGEVHEKSCRSLALMLKGNKKPLGASRNLKEAVRKAKKDGWSNADACGHCGSR